MAGTTHLGFLCELGDVRWTPDEAKAFHEDIKKIALRERTRRLFMSRRGRKFDVIQGGKKSA